MILEGFNLQEVKNRIVKIGKFIIIIIIIIWFFKV
jgi:hypothetical protein